MTSSVQYNGSLRTTCIHVKSNTKIITDAPTDNHGKGESFSPTDLVATALASCMFTIMGIEATKRSIDLTGAKAEVEKIMAPNPRRIDEIRIQITFPENKWDEETKKRLKQVALNCPVAKSIRESIKQSIQFQF